MAEDVVNFIHQQKLNKCVMIGHSMYEYRLPFYSNLIMIGVIILTKTRGAKTAMTVALDSPGLISALIPVDNAPVNAPLKSDFGKYVRGMQHIEAQNVAKQSDADKILKDYEEVSSPVKNAGLMLTAIFHTFLVSSYPPIPVDQPSSWGGWSYEVPCPCFNLGRSLE